VDAFHLFISAMAVWEAVEIWHHSSLFSDARARVELWEGKIGELLMCPFCLSVWVALAVVSLVEVSAYTSLYGPRWATYCSSIPIYTLAVARLSNLFNDLTYKSTRTPRHNRMELGDDDEEENEEDPGE
jgi:hypothetical protein